MAELWFESNISKKLYQQKCFLITTNQNICVVTSSSIYGNRGPVTGPVYLQIQTEQNTSLEYGHTNLVLHREWQDNKQIGQRAGYNQAASLPYLSSIATISH